MWVAYPLSLGFPTQPLPVPAGGGIFYYAHIVYDLLDL